LEFLINEHKYIAELESKLFNSDLVLSYITEAILEKNLYGVDINEESIEIAKLSLWLRTAERGRKLNSLSNHIKCGNSLISDPGIAGELAFNWENEFPDVFENGGFDVIIGNPPWGAKVDQAELKYIKDKHKDIIVRMTDSFMFFIDNSIKFTKLDGYLGLIVPDVFLYQKDNEKLRKKLISHFNITHALNLGDGVFENVARASSIVISHNFKVSNATTFVADISKEQLSNISTIELYNVKQNLFDSIPYTIFPTRDIEGYSILNRLKFDNLSDVIDQDGIQRGISPDLKDAFILKNTDKKLFCLEKEKLHPTVTGGIDVKKFSIANNIKTILYVRKSDLPEEIPNIITHLSKYKENITCKEVSQGKHPFYTLHRARDESIFTKPTKILGVITGDKIITAVDVNQVYPTDGLYLMNSNPSIISNRALSIILNSNLITYFYRLLSSENNRAMSQVKPMILDNLPIVKLEDKTQLLFEDYYDSCESITADLQKLELNFNNLLLNKFEIDQLSKKLINWSDLDFNEFSKELKKKKVKLSLSEESEWIVFFNENKTKAQQFKNKISELEQEININVYKLYGLSDDEIKVIEL